MLFVKSDQLSYSIDTFQFHHIKDDRYLHESNYISNESHVLQRIEHSILAQALFQKGDGKTKPIPRLKDGLSNVLRSEEHTSELQSRFDLVCRLLLEKKKKQK